MARTMIFPAGRTKQQDGRIQTVEDRKNSENFWIGHIDAAVAEVFAMMLQMPCNAVDEAPETNVLISARIEFSGVIDGDCVVRIPVRAAERLTDMLLDAEGDWDDEMIDDAVGELCNMIAGGWKSRFGMDAKCQISVPTVSRLPADEDPGKDGGVMRRFYGFDGDALEVAMALRRAETGGCADCRPVPFPSRLIA